MRVLALVTDAFGGHGGIAQYNRHFLTALCEQPQCEEVVALPRLVPNPIEPLPKRLTWSRSGLGGKVRYFLALAIKLLTDRRYDVIYCGHINLLPVAVIAKFFTGAPLVLQVHGIDAWKPTDSAFTNYLAARVDLCLAVSRLTRRRFLAWANLKPHKCVVLSNTLPDGVFSPGAKNPELLKRYGLQDKKVLMTFGRLVSEERYKGFDEVLNVLPLLRKEFPDLVYLIAGDGNDRERLQTKAGLLKVSEQVILTGSIPEAEKADYYRLADVYVMPSMGEGFGIVLLEALASGLPVIASREDGGRDALRDGTSGQLVSPADQAQIVEAVSNCLRSKLNPVPHSVFDFGNFRNQLTRIMGTLVPVASARFQPK